MSKLSEFRQQYPQYGKLSDEDLLARLHDKYYKDKVSLDDFTKKMTAEKTEPARPPSILPNAVQDLGAGIYKGMVDVISGPLQLGLDALKPEAGQAFTDFMKKTVEPSKAYQDSNWFTAGEIAGATVPYMAMPLAAGAGKTGALMSVMRGVGEGALIGGTQFQEGDTPEQRMGQRGVGALVGGAAGALADPVASGISKAVSKASNSGAIKSLVGELSQAYERVDPSLQGTQRALNKEVQKVSTNYRNLQDQVMQAGQNVRLPDNARSELAKEFVSIYSRVQDSPAKTSVARSLLDNIAGKVGAKGIKLPKELAGLSLDAKLQVTRQLQQQVSFGSLTYPELRKMSEDLGSFLKTKEGKELGDTLVGSLTDFNKSLGQTLKEVEKTNPGLKKAVKKVEDFKSKNLDIYSDPKVERFLTAKDDPARASAAADLVLHGDPESIKKLAAKMGPTGRNKVNQLLVSRGLVHAWDSEKNVLDPAKFVSYFDQLGKNGERFILPEDKLRIQGIQNLLSEKSLKLGQAPGAPKISETAIPHLTVAGGIWHMLMGDFVTGLKYVAGGQMTRQLVDQVNRMLDDKVGRTYLAAASRAKPGSPRMAQVTQAIAQRFGPAFDAALVGGTKDQD